MGARALNDGLAEHKIKKGDVGRNQTGNNGRQTMRTNIEIRRALYSGFTGLYPDGSGRTYWDVAIDSLLTKFANGERWAMHFVCDRLFGRVPYNVNLDVTQHHNFAHLSESELLARVEQLRTRLLADGVCDATAVTPSPSPEARANPGRELTLAPETDVPGQGNLEEADHE
jgi:hypothetical protein